ncbi:hypothetical protein HPP92_019367 [Vanilla planifolia]|uniref:Bulb-type lectin domain-containing protein n=1 Tax=Vanilla planifolia TaxID=51239 RepID=A0A835ULI3_VANPL|nr:hypothetical protein HPP92_019850 [Vanilla planifolia]KAG0465203.1 hypothetical protein HPP92_019367 [Vanilla planifolia]
MAATSNIFRSSLLVIVFVVLLLLQSSPSTANEANVLLTGDILSTDSELSNSKAVFVIQNDCNLVLYNKDKGFASNTYGAGANCTLTLNDHGQLLIESGNGTLVWFTPTGPIGKYAAVLLPNGQVGIFGPQVWSTTAVGTTNSVTDATEKFSTAPSDKNLLFSSQVLDKGEELVTRDYSFAVATDCGAVLTKATGNIVLWESKTRRQGDHCFARLNFHGQLAVLNDDNKLLWASNRPHLEGVYVLVLQINGVAAVYGPQRWTTAAF